jgi:hypothetical protein
MRALAVAVLLVACGPRSTSLAFRDATPEQYAAAFEAVTQWREACGVDVEISRDDGSVAVRVVPNLRVPRDVGLYHYDSDGNEWIHVDARRAADSALYAHEIGHALGMNHRPDGIMRFDVAFGTRVRPEDCP